MLIKIILLVLIVLIIWRVIDRYRRDYMRVSELAVWLVFWTLAGLLVIWPEASQRVAEIVGIGRGVDLVVYLALLLLFYLVFRIFVRLEQIESNLTKIVHKIALDEAKENRNQEARIKSR